MPANLRLVDEQYLREWRERTKEILTIPGKEVLHVMDDYDGAEFSVFGEESGNKQSIDQICELVREYLEKKARASRRRERARRTAHGETVRPSTASTIQ